MVSSVISPARSSILEIKPYVLSDAMLGESPCSFHLDSNENPFGCSPDVGELIQKESSKIHRYPSGTCNALRNAIGSFYNVHENEILCGNGVEELIHLLARTFIADGDEVIIPQYAFSVFTIASKACGAKAVTAPLVDWEITPDSILSHITPKTKVIFIDHPSNPIGRFMSGEDLGLLLTKIPPHILVVLDCAYGEFASIDHHYGDFIKERNNYPNLIILKTFSKAYGLAGLRLGFLTAHQELVGLINRIRAPFNVNSFAQKAGIIALKDQNFVQKTVQYVHDARTQIVNEIEGMGYSILPTKTNFILLECKNKPEDIRNYLFTKGIAVRSLRSYDLPNIVRISIGAPEAMSALLNALGEGKSLWQ